MFAFLHASRSDSPTSDEPAQQSVWPQLVGSTHSPEVRYQDCDCYLCESCRESSGESSPDPGIIGRYLTIQPPDRCFGLPREIEVDAPDAVRPVPNPGVVT